MSDVPDEAVEAALGTPMHDWDWSERDVMRERLEAAAPFLVAAERQRLHDLEARIETLITICGERAEIADHPGPAIWRALGRELRALVSEASASSPVSDDTNQPKEKP